MSLPGTPDFTGKRHHIAIRSGKTRPTQPKARHRQPQTVKIQKLMRVSSWPAEWNLPSD